MATQKATAKKATAKKATAKKATAKKVAPKKSTAKATAKRSTVKKPTTRDPAEMRAPEQKKTDEELMIERLLRKPTLEGLRAEGLAIRHPKLAFSLASLIADANEMVGGREDLADLEARGYRVNAHVFDRIDLLRKELVPASVDRIEARELSQQSTSEAEAMRLRLLQIRSSLAAKAESAGIAGPGTQLGTRTDRITPVVVRMAEVATYLRRRQSKLPDAAEVEALLTEAEALIDQHRESHTDGQDARGSAKASTSALLRSALLLWEALRHVSNVGLAAYANDPVREKRYRLDNVYADRPAKKDDAPQPSQP